VSICKRLLYNDDCQQFLVWSRLWTKQSPIEIYRYRVDGRPLVADLSLYQNESLLAELGFPLTNFTRRETRSQFVFATAADLNYFHISMDNIASIQSFLPNNSIYFYDLADSALSSRANKVSVETGTNCLHLNEFKFPAGFALFNTN